VTLDLRIGHSSATLLRADEVPGAAKVRECRNPGTAATRSGKWSPSPRHILREGPLVRAGEAFEGKHARSQIGSYPRGVALRQVEQCVRRFPVGRQAREKDIVIEDFKSWTRRKNDADF
jgi:hypothetical protein